MQRRRLCGTSPGRLRQRWSWRHMDGIHSGDDISGTSRHHRIALPGYGGTIVVNPFSPLQTNREAAAVARVRGIFAIPCQSREIRPPHVHGALGELTLTGVKQFWRPLLGSDLQDASGEGVATLAVDCQLFGIRRIAKATICG